MQHQQGRSGHRGQPACRSRMIDHVPGRSHALVIVAPLTLSAESENIGGGPEPFCTLPHRPILGAATFGTLIRGVSYANRGCSSIMNLQRNERLEWFYRIFKRERRWLV